MHQHPQRQEDSRDPQHRVQGSTNCHPHQVPLKTVNLQSRSYPRTTLRLHRSQVPQDQEIKYTDRSFVAGQADSAAAAGFAQEHDLEAGEGDLL